jgi:hypothetical protein
MKVIADLLEELQIVVQGLLGEKVMLETRLRALEADLWTAEEGKKAVMRDFLEAKEKLERELQASKHKLDQVHPEILSLQNGLENAEVQNTLLAMDIEKKDAEIKKLELRLRDYTSLTSPSFQNEEPIGKP